jgi:sialate O-acetylesterase
MSISRRALPGILAILVMAGSLQAEVRLPAVISDHMVLQSGAKAKVWGWADPGEEITVSIAGQKKSAVAAGDNNRWQIELDPLEAGGPHALTVAGKTTITVNDVLVGEVWLGSGQSNMNMRVSACRDFDKERADADFPKIRMFTESSGAAKDAQTVGKGTWVVCSAETVGTFSGTLYFFGRDLHRQLNTPVGLIHSSVGGTPIESWISPSVQRESADLKDYFTAIQQEVAAFDATAAKARYERALVAHKEAVAKAKAEGKPRPRAPVDPVAANARRGDVGGLFNGKISPLVPYTLKGILWYQGEANTAGNKPEFYERQLRHLVTDWRTRWGQGDLPFAWVQLPNFDGGNRDFAAVREAMRKALTLPNTGMAITIDIGEAKDIHPKNKQDVGHRLAAWALGSVYGKPVVPSGPLPQTVVASGKDVRITFQHAKGLTAKPEAPMGFEVLNEAGAWKPATARIDGEAVILTATEVAAPRAVRYAWANNPPTNLYNGAGLPASPFQWELKGTP